MHSIRRTSQAIVTAFLMSALARAGDPFLTPELRLEGAYESTRPPYSVIGVEVHEANRTAFVVANASDVLVQQSLNQMIRDIRSRIPAITRVMFYRSVLDKPAYPAFAIGDHLAVYVVADNKTYFGVGAKDHYGGWAHGPPR